MAGDDAINGEGGSTTAEPPGGRDDEEMEDGGETGARETADNKGEAGEAGGTVLGRQEVGSGDPWHH